MGGGGFGGPTRCMWCGVHAMLVQVADFACVLVWLCERCRDENANPKSKTRVAMEKSAAAFRARVAARATA